MYTSGGGVLFLSFSPSPFISQKQPIEGGDIREATFLRHLHGSPTPRKKV